VELARPLHGGLLMRRLVSLFLITLLLAPAAHAQQTAAGEATRRLQEERLRKKQQEEAASVARMGIRRMQRQTSVIWHLRTTRQRVTEPKAGGIHRHGARPRVTTALNLIKERRLADHPLIPRLLARELRRLRRLEGPRLQIFSRPVAGGNQLRALWLSHQLITPRTTLVPLLAGQ